MKIKNKQKLEFELYKINIIMELLSKVIELSRKFFNSKKNGKKLKIILVDK